MTINLSKGNQNFCRKKEEYPGQMRLGRLLGEKKSNILSDTQTLVAVLKLFCKWMSLLGSEGLWVWGQAGEHSVTQNTTRQPNVLAQKLSDLIMVLISLWIAKGFKIIPSQSRETLTVWCPQK